MSWELDKESHLWTDWKSEHWDRFKHSLRHDWRDISHSYVNLFVEGCRTFPYTIGHVLAIIGPPALVLLAVL